MLIEETLIRNQIPFDPVFNEQLDALLADRIKVLVLGGQSCVSDPVLSRISDFVAAGGGLLVTGNSGGRTTWAVARAQNASLQRLELIGTRSRSAADEGVTNHANFEAVASDTGEQGMSSTWPPTAVNVDQVLGAGKVAYIPGIIPSVKEEVWYPQWRKNVEHGYYDIRGNASDPQFRDHKEYPFVNWRLPVSAGHILDAIRWLYQAPFIVDAPDTTVVNWLRQEDKQRDLLHFLNYANDRPVSAASVFMLTDQYTDADVIWLDPRLGRKKIGEPLKQGRITVPSR